MSVSRLRSLDNLTMWQVATLAIYALGGAHTHQDSEDVAVKCHEIDPRRFGRKKYPQYPSNDAAKEALNDARRPRNGELIAGSPDTGWLLTPSGVDWAVARAQLLETASVAPDSTLPARMRRVIQEVRNHVTYQKWDPSASPPAGSETATAVLLSASTAPESVERRIVQLRSAARAIGDVRLEEYLAWLSRTLDQES